MKKTEGLLHKLASSLAIDYTDILHGRDPSVICWDELRTHEQDHCREAMKIALEQIISRELPDSVPTRAHLRSHLSIQGAGSYTPHLVGFNDLYEDVLLSVKLAKTSGELDVLHLQKQLDEANLELDNTCDKLAETEEELRDVEGSRDYERGQRNGNRDWAIQAEEKLEAANQRIAELEAKCNEDLNQHKSHQSWQAYSSNVKHSHDGVVNQSYKNILDRIAAICGVTYGNGDDFVNAIIKAKQIGEKLKAEVSELTKRNDDHQSEMRELKLDIEGILEEFHLQCPTDDVLDMVRCACEGGRDLTDRHKFLKESVYLGEVFDEDAAQEYTAPPREEYPRTYKSSDQSSVWPVCVTIIVCTMVPFTAWFIGELIKA